MNQLKTRISFMVVTGGLTLSLCFPSLALASGTTVIRSKDIEVTGVDNPCTLPIESLTLKGSLQQVLNPAGKSHLQLHLKNNEYTLVEKFTSQQDQDTHFRQHLVSYGSAPDFTVTGVIHPDGSIEFSTKCTP